MNTQNNLVFLNDVPYNIKDIKHDMIIFTRYSDNKELKLSTVDFIKNYNCFENKNTIRHLINKYPELKII